MRRWRANQENRERERQRDRQYQREVRAAERMERDRARRAQDLAVQGAERERLETAYEGDWDAYYTDWGQESVKRGLGIGRYGAGKRRRLASQRPRQD